MPDAAPPGPITEAFWTPNVRKQVIAQLATVSIPAAATEGRVYADTTLDRLVFDSGTAKIPGPAWSSAGRIGWSVTDATPRSIPTGTGTYTSVTFSTEVVDTSGFFTAGGTTVTIPTDMGGLYCMTFTTLWASSPGANSVIEFQVNGVTGYRFPVGAAVQIASCAATIMVPLAAGNTVVVRLSQGSGGAINVTPSAWFGYRLEA